MRKNIFKRTTITLSPFAMSVAHAHAGKYFSGNMSAYLAHLILAEAERRGQSAEIGAAFFSSEAPAKETVAKRRAARRDKAAARRRSQGRARAKG